MPWADKKRAPTGMGRKRLLSTLTFFVMTPVEYVPAELIGRTLDFLELRYIIIVSHVCRHWRAIALDHPHFWRDLSITTTSQASLDLFQARISRRTGLIHVSLCMPDEEATNGPLLDSLFPLVLQHLHRIEILHITGNVFFWPGINNRLVQRAAPALRVFEIHLVGGPPSMCDPLPLDLFDSTSPLLREVTIQGIMLYQVQSWPSCFSDVEVISLLFHDFEAHGLNLDCLWTLPSLKRVHIRGGCIIDDIFLSDQTVAVLRRLDALQLWSTQPLPLELLECMAMSRLPVLELSDRRCESIMATVAHLQGDLCLTVLPRGDATDMFHLTYTPAATSGPAQRRAFMERLSYYLPGSHLWPSYALCLDELKTHVVHLTFHASLWPVITPEMAPFLSCKTLVLQLEDGLPTSNAPRVEAYFPAVSTLVLTNASGRRMSLRSDDILEFQQRWILLKTPRTTRDITCELVGIQLVET